MKVSFNLMYEKWIPVEDPSGKIEEKGILDVLKNSEKMMRITDPSPIFEYGMYRLLIALVSDIYEINDLEGIVELLQTGNFNDKKLDDYIAKWESSFDLFDAERPFYQIIPEAQDDNRKFISSLLHQIPSGTNVIHFFHSLERQSAISPVICARAICSIPVFMQSAGKGYSPSINGIPPWYVLIEGENLFETIVLNTCGSPLELNSGNYPVAWKKKDHVKKKEEIIAVSTLQGFTWQSRRIHFYPEKGGICSYTGKPTEILVRKMFFEPGWKFVGKWTDPHVSYRNTKKGTFTVWPSEGKQLWRDVGPLLLLKETMYTSDKKISYDRPVVIDQFTELIEYEGISKEKQLNINVYGIRTDMKAKVFEWQKERLSLPTELLKVHEAGKKVQEAVDLADYVDYAIRKSIKSLHPKASNKKEVFVNLSNKASKEFWDRLEPIFKGKFLQELAKIQEDDLKGPEMLKNTWKTDLKNISRLILDKYLDLRGSTAESLRSQILSQDMFNKITYKKLKLTEFDSNNDSEN